MPARDNGSAAETAAICIKGIINDSSKTERTVKEFTINLIKVVVSCMKLDYGCLAREL